MQDEKLYLNGLHIISLLLIFSVIEKTKDLDADDESDQPTEDEVFEDDYEWCEEEECWKPVQKDDGKMKVLSDLFQYYYSFFQFSS